MYRHTKRRDNIKRPLVWALGGLIVVFLIFRAFYSETDDARFFIFDEVWKEEVSAQVQGEVDYLELRQQEDAVSTSVYLKEVHINIKEKEYFLERLLVYLDGKVGVDPGNIIWLSGDLKEFTKPTNPGQFDQRAYYKEKGIYYRFQADEMKVINTGFVWWKKILYRVRDSMAQVYATILPQKEAGIITAMILGDKSVLDVDMKKLYQTGGISHILAISGLHITILGMALYHFLRYCDVNAKVRVVICVCLLVGYGKMTNFSVSTSRAVIMMILYLIAEWIGRSYDSVSALAFSGIIILLQKPFALYSCSFLLSFGAILGLNLIQPVLNDLVYGSSEKQRERKRKLRQWRKEVIANDSYGKILVWIQQLTDKIVSMLLSSFSVQLMTLPIILYFFFEVPLYGIIINIFVIPLASVLIIFAFIGGITGCICISLGKFFIGIVYFILQFYEKICLLFQKLPGQLQILGRPFWQQIVLYYVLLLIFLILVKKIVEKKGTAKKAFWLIPVIMIVLLFPFQEKNLSITFLDVGQGDGIFIHSPAGTNILLDGGSTSVSKVGTYRIIPFLKYNGIRQIDYMFMTHSDEDHINGLTEILEGIPQHGIKVKNIMLPKIKDKSGFVEIIKLAERNGIVVSYLSVGDYWKEAELELVCLNPTNNMETESSNESSITLSLTYREFSCLLTGDIEGVGEKQVENVLKTKYKEQMYRLPEEYTVLKVAHHGSKNSSREELLKIINPKLAVISCGEENRYGHPHKETLNRLNKSKSDILITAKNGAITMKIGKKKTEINCFRQDMEKVCKY